MTLLVSTVAAIVCTLLWYQRLGREDYKLGTLALMFWGASLMWFVDAVVEYMEMGAEYFRSASVPAGRWLPPHPRRSVSSPTA